MNNNILLKEEFLHEYLSFGWVTPEGNLLLPNSKMKKHPTHYYAHGDLYIQHIKKTTKNDELKDIFLPPVYWKSVFNDAFKNNFVRWSITVYKNEPILYINCKKDIHPNIIAKTIFLIEKNIINGKIEKIFKTPQKLFKKVAVELLNTNGEDIFAFKIFDSKYLKQIINWVEDMNKEKDFSNKNIESEYYQIFESCKLKPIEEAFLEEYQAFGWITSNGKLLLPTKSMIKSSEYMIHSSVLKVKKVLPSNFKGNPYLYAFEQGMARWFIEFKKPETILYIECGINMSSKALIKGYSEIEDGILDRSFEKLFEKNQKLIDYISIEIMNYNTGKSAFFRVMEVNSFIENIKHILQNLQKDYIETNEEDN